MQLGTGVVTGLAPEVAAGEVGVAAGEALGLGVGVGEVPGGQRLQVAAQ